MPRTVIIRIVVDNKDAINAAKAQAIAQKSLNDTIAAGNSEIRKAEEHANKLASAQTQTSKSTKDFASSFAQWFIQLRLISSAYNALTSVITSSISSYANLELSIAKVAAVTGNSKEQLQNLQGTIYELARTTAVSTNDIAGAALELSKLGFAGKELEIALAGVTKLSSILGDSLETTGNLVGGVIQTFDLSAEQAAHVADKLFVATGKSALNIEGFRVAFGLAGNVAASAGISFEELAASFAALSNQGIRASTIGTGFRNFIVDLSQEGSKAQKALGGSIEELGLVGAMKKLSELKLSPGSIVDIFGKPGAPVAAGIAKMGDAYRKAIGDIKESDGALKDSGEIINVTLVGSVKLLTNNLNELFQTTASPAAGAFKGFFLGVADNLKTINELKSFFKKEQDHNRDPFTSLGVSGKDFGNLNDEERLKLIRDFKKQNEEDRKTQTSDDLFAEHRAYAKDANDNPVSKATKQAGDNTKQIIKDMQTIGLEFKRFEVDGTKNGKDPFSFSESEAALAKIRDNLTKLHPDDAKQAEALIGQLKAFEDIDAKAGFSKNKERYQEDKSLADAKRKNITVTNTDSLGETDQYIQNMQEELDNFNQALEQTKLAFNEIDGALKTMSSQMVDSLFSWEWSWTHFGYVVKDIFKQLVKDFIAMEIRIIALKAAIKVGGYLASVYTGGGSVVAADAAGGYVQGAAEANFNSQYNTAVGAGFLASGYDGYVSGATKFIAGEAGMERVTVTPMNKPGFYHNESSGGGMTIIVQGDVFNAERLVDKVNKSNELSRARYV